MSNRSRGRQVLGSASYNWAAVADMWADKSLNYALFEPWSPGAPGVTLATTSPSAASPSAPPPAASAPETSTAEGATTPPPSSTACFFLTEPLETGEDFAPVPVGLAASPAGLSEPKWADDEVTLDDLRARIHKNIDYVASFEPAHIDGCETREIQLVKRNGDVLRYQGEEYLKHNAMPNFYFHAMTLYALLRHAGVPVGKADYLGG